MAARLSVNFTTDQTSTISEVDARMEESRRHVLIQQIMELRERQKRESPRATLTREHEEQLARECAARAAQDSQHQAQLEQLMGEEERVDDALWRDMVERQRRARRHRRQVLQNVNATTPPALSTRERRAALMAKRIPRGQASLSRVI